VRLGCGVLLLPGGHGPGAPLLPANALLSDGLASLPLLLVVVPLDEPALEGALVLELSDALRVGIQVLQFEYIGQSQPSLKREGKRRAISEIF
jgi:hypothetical protein